VDLDATRIRTVRTCARENPTDLVVASWYEGDAKLFQSIAILEYFEEKFLMGRDSRSWPKGIVLWDGYGMSWADHVVKSPHGLSTSMGLLGLMETRLVVHRRD
jgi:hypothetical protein